jgi:pimeloyl-ACP methyl ester carboxylesterase
VQSIQSIYMKNSVDPIAPVIAIAIGILLTTCSTKDEQYITSADGVSIYFQEAGVGKPVILFIHGFSPHSDCWRDQVNYFSKDHQVIALDLPGFGKSGQNRREWSMDSYGDDIESLVSKLNLDDVILVGHSMGGLVALKAATKIPDKLRCVVIVDMLNDINSVLTDSQIEDLINWVRPKIRKGNLDSLDVFFSSRQNTLRYDSLLPSEIPSFWWGIVRNTFRWARDDAKQTIKEIKAPVYSINADNTPTNVDAMRQYSPNFKATIIKGTTHYVNWDKPDEFNKALEAIVNSN